MQMDQKAKKAFTVLQVSLVNRAVLVILVSQVILESTVSMVSV